MTDYTSREELDKQKWGHVGAQIQEQVLTNCCLRRDVAVSEKNKRSELAPIRTNCHQLLWLVADKKQKKQEGILTLNIDKELVGRRFFETYFVVSWLQATEQDIK